MLVRLSQLKTSGDRMPRLKRTMVKAFGLLLAIAGIFWMVNELKGDKHSIRITGKIYSVYERDEKGSKKYFPAIELWPNDGQVIHFQGPASSTKPETGTSVPVIYNPLQPEFTRVDTFSQHWLYASVMISVGFAIFIAAAFWRQAGNGIGRQMTIPATRR